MASSSNLDHPDNDPDPNKNASVSVVSFDYTDKHNLKEWMTNLPIELQKMSLYRLAIPGSHNSGSFACEVTSGVSPDAPSLIKKLIKVPGFGVDMLLSIVQGFSICQSLDIKEQLEAGIRYFDLRVGTGTKKKSDQLFIMHSLYGPKMEEIVLDMNEFLEEHPHEVLILDFNHFYAMDTEHHMMLITFLISTFSSKICAENSMDDLTLEQLWDAGKQVIILYHDENGKEFEEFWPAGCIASPWPNTDVSTVCISRLSTYHAQPQPKSKFFVTQGILTPTFTSIMKKLLTANLYSLNKELVPNLMMWIKTSSETCLHQPNIIMADFIHEGDFIQHVLDLNKRRIGIS